MNEISLAKDKKMYVKVLFFSILQYAFLYIILSLMWNTEAESEKRKGRKEGKEKGGREKDSRESLDQISFVHIGQIRQSPRMNSENQ